MHALRSGPAGTRRMGGILEGENTMQGTHQEWVIRAIKRSGPQLNLISSDVPL